MGNTMTRRLPLWLFTFILMGFLIPWNQSITVQAAKGKVTGVKVTNLPSNTLTLKKGKSKKLKVKVTGKGSFSKKVKYKTSNKKVATVSSSGKIKAKKNGKAKITVTTVGKPKKKAVINLTVGTPVKSITLNPKTATIQIGETITLTANVSPAKASNTGLIWSSSDTAVATVNANGLVKGLKAGTVSIIATAKDGSGKSAAANITVQNPTPVVPKEDQPNGDPSKDGETPTPSEKEEVEIPIDENHFPDELFREYLGWSFGDSLSKDEIENTDYISLTREGVHDLTGIEYFTSLEKLWCSFNDLTTLDLSKNEELIELHCQYNKLVSLDVSKNTKLKVLECSENELTTLDLSQNKELTNLICDGNKLTSLDLSNNTKLTELNCSSNQLFSLDLSKNVGLYNNTQSSDIELYLTGGKVRLSDYDSNIDYSRITYVDGADFSPETGEFSNFRDYGEKYFTVSYLYDTGCAHDEGYANTLSVYITIYKDEKINVESITLDKTEITLGFGETTVLTATVLPENATHQGVSWWVSYEGDNDVIEYDYDAVLDEEKNQYPVRALYKEGYCVLHASGWDDTEASCVIRVVDKGTE